MFGGIIWCELCAQDRLRLPLRRRRKKMLKVMVGRSKMLAPFFALVETSAFFTFQRDVYLWCTAAAAAVFLSFEEFVVIFDEGSGLRAKVCARVCGFQVL